MANLLTLYNNAIAILNINPNQAQTELELVLKEAITKIRNGTATPEDKYVLGLMYSKGDGVAIDDIVGLSYLMNSSKYGYVKSYVEMAKIWIDKEEMGSAKEALEKAIELGDEEAKELIKIF